MKKILFLALSISALTMVFTSCEDQEDAFYRGVTIQVNKLYYYPLDANYEGTVDVSDPNVSSMKVFLGENEIGSLTLSNGSGSFSIAKANITPITTIGNKASLKFYVEAPDGPAARVRSVSMKDPVTITGLKNMEPKDTIVNIEYAIAADCTPPTSVVMTKQVNSNAPVEVETQGTMMAGYYELTVTPDMNKDTVKFVVRTENANGSTISEHTLIIAEQRAWNFEEYEGFVMEFAPWTLIDNDKLPTYGVSSFDFPNESYTGSWMIFDWEGTDPAEVSGWQAHSGTKFAACLAAIPDGSQGNDDWMVSKPFVIGDGFTLSLWAKSVTVAYGPEIMVIKVLDVDTDVETNISGGSGYIAVPAAWTNYTFDLTAFSGKKVKIMIGSNSYDTFALFVDDFEILEAGGKSIFTNGFESQVPVEFDIRKVVM